MRRLVGALAALLTIGTTAIALPVAATAAPITEVGEYHLAPPTRLVDTRINLGHTGPLASNELITIDPRAAVGASRLFAGATSSTSPSSKRRRRATSKSRPTPVRRHRRGLGGQLRPRPEMWRTSTPDFRTRT